MWGIDSLLVGSPAMRPVAIAMPTLATAMSTMAISREVLPAPSPKAGSTPTTRNRAEAVRE
jgi:hypothetical protein